MRRKPTQVHRFVQLTAVWGNGDADSTIKVSRRRCEAIRAGAEYTTSTRSWYEGRRQRVWWAFSGGKVSIGGGDGMQCVVALPVSELFAEMPPSP